ncbi:unnamed protein product [Closterium sp. Yama58-4]|nr:unnamed protein product [Closterium sp. Yama58-4]
MSSTNCLTILSLNINGLGSEGKRQALKRWIKTAADVVILADMRVAEDHNFWTELNPHSLAAAGAPTREGGVAILSFRDGVVVEDVHRHVSGRLLHARVRWGARQMRLLAVYFPAQAPPRGSFLETEFSMVVADLPKGEQLVVAGDFKMIEDPVQDKSNRQGVVGDNNRMMHMLQDFHVKDVFRELNPDECQLTFYCGSAKVSRIDRVLVSQSLHLVARVAHRQIPKGITDPKCTVCVRLVWRDAQEPGPGVWRFPARLVKRPGVEVAVAEVIRRHGAEGCDDFDKLSSRLGARQRKYDKEERRQVKMTRRALEEQVCTLRQKVIADPSDDKLQALLTNREAMLEREAREILAAAKSHFAEAFDEQVGGDEAEPLVNDKSPGSDGIPKELFQHQWELLKKPVMNMVEQFVTSGKLPEVANEAVTILLYKKGEETDVRNYRPITLLTSVYKILAKVMATRMKVVLDHVISKEQFGFLPGRRLTDAVSLVTDLIETAKNEGNDWYLLLIDFEKAYDSVRRGFMLETIAKLGFPPRSVGWIESLHRDPLSRLVEKRELGIGEKGCERLAYVGYADDTTLLLEGEAQLSEAGAVLQDFAAVSGLKVNAGKSAVLPPGKNVGEPAPAGLGYKWVEKETAERLLGV